MEGEKLLFATEVDDKDRDAAVKQEFKLFIKASQIDKETRGSCPVCQHWFMVAYLIAQKQDGVNFSVYTVQESSPPKEFEGWSKRFPVVLPVSCIDKKGNQISGELYDNFDEIEKFFEAINRGCGELKRHNIENSQAVAQIEDIYSKFNQFMTGGKGAKEKLTKALRDLNDELESKDCTFLIDDELCYCDCFLLPRLQHIKVAGKKYKVFEIPDDCKALWIYLDKAYKQPAFRQTLPSDQDIALHYETKAVFPKIKNLRTEKFTTDTTVPAGLYDERNGGQVQEQENDTDMQEMQGQIGQQTQEVGDNGVEYDHGDY